jgi:glycosyltransferase involved in cell wall biosynthesis
MNETRNNEPVGILFVNTSAEKIGGGQVSLLELLRVLDRRRFAPFGVVSADGVMRDSLEALDVPTEIVELPPVGIPGPSVFRVARSIADRAVDLGVRLIHSNDTRAHVYSGLAARRAGVPSVFHYRVSYSDGIHDRTLPRLCTKIVAVSRATAERFPGFRRKLEVIENGVDTERFRPVPGSGGLPPQLSGKQPLIGTIGRLERAKGLHTFIESVAALAKEYPEIGAIVVGRGDAAEKKTLFELCGRLEVTENVIFRDETEDVAALLSGLDVYALLSDNEGLNRSIMEAMACETAVVATRVGGNPEIIEDPAVGRLVPFDDPGAAAAAIGEYLADDALRRQTGKLARERIVRGLSLARHKRRMEELFGTLVGAD